MKKLVTFLKSLNFTLVAVVLMVFMLVMVGLISLLSRSAQEQARENVLEKATGGQEYITENLAVINDPGTSIAIDGNKLVFYFDTDDPVAVEATLRSYADKIGISYQELVAGSVLFYPTGIREQEGERGRSDIYTPNPTVSSIDEILPIWEATFTIEKLEPDKQYNYLVQYSNPGARVEATQLLEGYSVDLDEVIFLETGDERIQDYIDTNVYGN